MRYIKMIIGSDRFQPSLVSLEIEKIWYAERSSIAQAALIKEKTEPALTDLRRAISGKNNSLFEAAYMRITAACNQCHQAAGVGFIVVQVPTKSPFSNQKFDPVRE